jgi:hypothetical protein
MIKKIQDSLLFVSIVTIVALVSVAHMRFIFAEDGGTPAPVIQSSTTANPNPTLTNTVPPSSANTPVAPTPSATQASASTSAPLPTDTRHGGDVSPIFNTSTSTPGTVISTPSITGSTALVASSSAAVNDVAHIVTQLQHDTDYAKTVITTEINKINISSTSPVVASSTQVKHEDERIQSKKDQLIHEVNDALSLKNISVKPQTITDLHKKVNTVFTEIGQVKNTNTNEQKQQINAVIATQEDQIAQDKKILTERKGLDLFSDDDHDGVSNFDEIYIYHTDPEKYSTTGGLSDGQKILLGIDPLSTSTSATTLTASTTAIAITNATSSKTETVPVPRIQYENPTVSTNILPQTLLVTDIKVTEKATINKSEVAKKIAFSGKALPNSFVTLYIYSTPIIVTVKTDYDGNWTYSLDKELENGHHSMYVAMVNNSGKVIARSNPVPFVKQAAAVEIDSNVATAKAPQGFFRTYFIQLSGAILLGALVIGLVIIGMRKVNDLPEA